MIVSWVEIDSYTHREMKISFIIELIFDNFLEYYEYNRWEERERERLQTIYKK